MQRICNCTFCHVTKANLPSMVFSSVYPHKPRWTLFPSPVYSSQSGAHNLFSCQHDVISHTRALLVVLLATMWLILKPPTLVTCVNNIANLTTDWRVLCGKKNPQKPEVLLNVSEVLFPIFNSASFCQKLSFLYMDRF